MKSHGIIYQYIDKPAPPDPILVDASKEENIIFVNKNTSPEASKKPIAIPDNTPVRVIGEKKEKSDQVWFSSSSNAPSLKSESAIGKISSDQIAEIRSIGNTISRNRFLRNISKETIKKKLDYSFRIMIGISMIGMILLATPFLYAEATLRISPPETQEEIDFSEPAIVDDVVDTPTFSKIINEKYIQKLDPVNTDYSVVIPKIGVNSPIIANVDAGDKAEYSKALQNGAAHAKGTALPDEKGSSYVFAHSTDYFWNIAQFNAIFYLLKDLEIDDQIHIVYKDKLYSYKVSEKRVVNADDTYFLKSNPNDNRLILQTCWPPGTVWKRMLIFAEPIETPADYDLDMSYSLDKEEIN